MTVKEKLKGKITKDQIKQREKSGIKLDYLECHTAIRNANECFDFNWSYEVKELKQVCEYDYNGKKKVGFTAVVRVIANIDGVDVVKEDFGAGSQVAKDLFEAIEGAGKEAVSDALKRALKAFGDMFGLSLYDKDNKNHKDESEQLMDEMKASNPARPLGIKEREELKKKIGAVEFAKLMNSGKVDYAKYEELMKEAA